jgi:hypothetical protein
MDAFFRAGECIFNRIAPAGSSRDHYSDKHKVSAIFFDGFADAIELELQKEASAVLAEIYLDAREKAPSGFGFLSMTSGLKTLLVGGPETIFFLLEKIVGEAPTTADKMASIKQFRIIGNEFSVAME